MRLLSPWLVLGSFFLTPPGMVQAQTRNEFDALRAEVVELRKQVDALKKDLVSVRLLAAPPRKSNLEVRFEAASLLSISSDQQAAYEILAIDAAKQGDLKYTKICIDKIFNSTPRQTAIYRASLFLSMAGLEKDGLALAKTLAESGMRNKALLKIARGELDE